MPTTTLHSRVRGDMMASFQAHFMNALIRWRIKRRLPRSLDVRRARAVFSSGPVIRPSPRVVVAPATFGGVHGEWVEPRQTADAILLYLHGGGYFACSPQTHRPLTTWLAKHGFRVFAPEYRLAPEHPFPAALEDAVAVYRGLLAAGNAPGRMVIAGDSAGGGLALATLISARDAGLPLPAAAALFSPWTDLAATGSSLESNKRRDVMFYSEGIGEIAKLYLGGADPRTPLASPLYANLAGLPPLVIQVGEREVLRDDSIRLAERARAAGVTVDLSVWPVVPHVWQIFHPVIPEGRQALTLAAAFLRRALSQDGVAPKLHPADAAT